MPPAHTDKRMAAAKAWDDLLAEIRTQPGFEDLMRPLPYAELLRAAQEGPVVILNVSQWRCDALIVSGTGVNVVPLPELTLADTNDMVNGLLDVLHRVDEADEAYSTARDSALHGGSSLRQLSVRRHQELMSAQRSANAYLETVLTWLWRTVAAVVLPHLPQAVDIPRIWWCPTGPLTLLPLHAAHDGRGRSLIDHAVSSYTPTLRALINARRPYRPSRREMPMLVVSTFPKEAQELLEGPLATSSPTVLSGSNATVTRVTEQLLKHSAVHVHVHGEQDLQDPSKGAFLLADGRLSVSAIASLASDADFAGLAACKTAVGGADVLDESITLASALHYAGFRHVVAALWSIGNQDAIGMFDSIYEDMTSSGSFEAGTAAAAVRKAVMQLRAECPDEPHRWASLIHVGP